LRQVAVDVNVAITRGGDARVLLRRPAAVDDRVHRISLHAADSPGEADPIAGPGWGSRWARPFSWGTSSTTLAMGSRLVVKAVVPVPEHTSRPVMLRLHRHLHARLRAAETLTRTSVDFADADAAHQVAAIGIQYFGAE
jgi:hypothetical protein